jgi:hypothetical protein
MLQVYYKMVSYSTGMSSFEIADLLLDALIEKVGFNCLFEKKK